MPEQPFGAHRQPAQRNFALRYLDKTTAFGYPPPMLHINDLTYRIAGRLILDGATVAIPTGHKVGLVGRNGTGKTTMLKLITGEIPGETGSVTLARNAKIGHVAQEAPGGDVSLLDWVLEADTERAASSPKPRPQPTRNASPTSSCA